MIWLLVIGVLVVLAYRLFFMKMENKKNVVVETKDVGGNVVERSAEPNLEGRRGRLVCDENGLKYWEVVKLREVPRKTYLYGLLRGKYWGELDKEKDGFYERSKFFDFNIYEAEIEVKAGNRDCRCIVAGKIVCDGVHKESEGPFDFELDSSFQKGRLPAAIPCIIFVNGRRGEYSIVLHDPQLRGIRFSRELHQMDGGEVFGTIEGEVTGYLVDFIEEEFVERIPVLENDSVKPMSSVSAERTLSATSVATGNVEYKNGYFRKEFYYSDYKSKYWGEWRYKASASEPLTEGCFSAGIGILGVLLGVVFLLLVLPKAVFLLPFVLIAAALRVIPINAWGWVFRVLAVVCLFAFLAALIKTGFDASSAYIPRPVDPDEPEEARPQLSPIVDSGTGAIREDTLIAHLRSWKDYSGNSYVGRIWVRNSSWAKASEYKNSLNVTGNTRADYDEVLFRLKEFDKANLGGVYKLFDSIRLANELSRSGFAEVIVSFVQDIPYTVVLPYACDPNLYSDEFIRKYLSSTDARCDGYEKYGINSPVEFMASLKGDCDTRALLCYTLLSHYGYDVAVLSSEVYNHSLIGINLPYEGVAYQYDSQRYVLWETTAENMRAGLLPKEISNLNYWRISLKSK